MPPGLPGTIQDTGRIIPEPALQPDPQEEEAVVAAEAGLAAGTPVDADAALVVPAVAIAVAQNRHLGAGVAAPMS